MCWNEKPISSEATFPVVSFVLSGGKNELYLQFKMLLLGDSSSQELRKDEQIFLYL